jgi:1,4-alpha-glucan branching enzyme/maltooligosyltrehalose trehalohydrolase
MRIAHEMPFGAQLREGGGVDFRLWAPAPQRVDLVLFDRVDSPPRFVAAQRGDDGMWSCLVPDARAGTLYQWRIDGDLKVPDPASRHNPHGVHAPSAVVDPRTFEWDDGWTGRPWHEVVLYELHVGAFTPEGAYAAAAQRLQALADLGITAIELMPLADFPGRFGWGYDGVLPFAPHAPYGSPDELKQFIQAAHRLGLMVFVDVVYNHFGPDGNYLHAYAPQFFSKTHTSPWGAAINFDGDGSRRVRDFFIHNALYWTREFQVDGLRLDAVHAIVDGSTPHILEEISQAVRGATQGRHVHLVLENENNDHHWLAPAPQPGRYDGQWNDDFHHIVHVAMTGETQRYYHDYGDQPLDLLARCLTHGMLFEHSARHEGGARKEIRPTPPQPLTALVNFAHNHDQVGNRARGERLSQLVPPEARLLPTLLALLTPAIPMLFFGEEFGAPEPWLYFADWDGELREAVREGRKREFGHQGGDELPDPCSARTFDASRPDWTRRDTEEGRKDVSVIGAAVKARAKWITPRQSQLLTGQHTAQRVGATGIAVQWRYDDGRMLSLELNLGAEPLVVPGQHVGPVEAQYVFRLNWTLEDEAGTWPAWGARWTLGPEITL